MEYRNTEIPSLGLSPSQILMSRRCRTILPIKDSLLKPQVLQNIKKKNNGKKFIIIRNL